MIALAAFRPRPTYWITSTSLPQLARRNKSESTEKTSEDLSNPILDDYLQKKEREASNKPSGAEPRFAIREGKLSSHPSSLFLSEREIPGWHDNLTSEEKAQLKQQAKTREADAQKVKDRQLMAMKLDPDVKARRSLERRLVIRGVKRHGRLTKAEHIARTERSSNFSSVPLPTSVKKLQKVVNQLAGKTVSEALVQLRFSKKRVARDVIKGLELAQDEAIEQKGMGLQGEGLAMQRWMKQREKTDAGKPRDIWDYKTSPDDKGTAKAAKKLPPTTIELKDGSKKVIRDPSEIYIDQMWVNRCQPWFGVEQRARGRTNRLIHRTTSKSHPITLPVSIHPRHPFPTHSLYIDPH